MGILDENGCEFEACVQVKISDRLRALQKNATKWQPIKSIGEELPEKMSTLKERRKVFANEENRQNHGDENKSPNFTLVSNRKAPFHQRRNQEENKPFAFVKFQKKIAEPAKKSNDLSFISSKRQLVTEAIAGNVVDGEVNKAGGEKKVEQPKDLNVFMEKVVVVEECADQKLEFQQKQEKLSSEILAILEQNQGMSDEVKEDVEVAEEEQKSEEKPSYLEFQSGIQKSPEFDLEHVVSMDSEHVLIAANVTEDASQLLLCKVDFNASKCPILDEFNGGFSFDIILPDSMDSTCFAIFDLGCVNFHKGHFSNGRISIEESQVVFGVELFYCKLEGERLLAFQIDYNEDTEQEDWTFVEYQLNLNFARKMNEWSCSPSCPDYFQLNTSYFWSMEKLYVSCGELGPESPFSIAVFDATDRTWSKTTFTGIGEPDELMVDENDILTISANDGKEDKIDWTIYRFPMRLSATKRSVALPQRRVPTRFQNAVKSNNPLPTISLNSQLHLETDDKENREDEVLKSRPKLRVSSAIPFQLPVIGKEHCGVQLRHVDKSSSFPCPMLIRAISIGKQIDLRLVHPSKKSASNNGAYLLATAKELIIRNGMHAIVQEKSKIAQLAHEIVAGKEMFAYSGKPKLANEDGTAEAAFWCFLEEEGEVNFDGDLQEIYSKSFAFYKINDSGEAVPIECESVTGRILDSSQVLVLDFGSEIYTWLGRNCNRSLSKHALAFVEKLKSSPMPKQMAEFVMSNNEDKRPKWVLCRRLSEGIADSLFRHKFSIDSVPSPNIKSNTSSRPSKLPFSNNLLLRQKPTPSSSVSNAQLKDESVLAEDLASKFANSSPSKESGILELEDTEIRPFDSNVFTEHLNFYVLNGESLETLDEQPKEFDCHKCYVVEWRYRVERGGVRKLNLAEAKKHDTGRERGVYFYWLGQSSTVKEQSFCALALRNKDRERLEHIRLEQGHEHPVFIRLFDQNGFIVSGVQSNSFLVHSYGLEGNLLAMMEMRGQKGRSQTVMIKIVNDKLECQRGKQCPQSVWDNSKVLAQKLANIRQLTFNCSESLEFDNLQPLSWSNSPRFYRIYELEGDELLTNRSHFTFPSHQNDLKDGCILVENDNFLWIWSDGAVSTFALKVANIFWTVERKRDAETEAKVICNGDEPDEFMALFPEWKEEEADENKNQPKSPQSLVSLLNERTKTRSLKEVRDRNLPEGCDLKNLEQYLSDEEFYEVFKLTKQEFVAQPKWKQIQLKKSANLF